MRGTRVAPLFLGTGRSIFNACVNGLLARIRTMVVVYYSSEFAGRLGQYQSTSSRRHLETLERCVELCKLVLEVPSFYRLEARSTS